VSSSTPDVAAASMSAADFYAKQVQTAPTPAPASLPTSKPAVPAKISSSVFFKPGGTAPTSSISATSSSASASSSSSSLSSSRPSMSSGQKQGVFFKVNSLGFEQKVSDAITVVPIAQGRVSEPIKPTATFARESTAKLPDYVEDANSKHISTLVSPPTTATVTATKATSNLFDDDDVDDSDLFTHTTTTSSNTHSNLPAAASTHPLGIVGRVTSIVRPAKVAEDLFGDVDGVKEPAVVRQHSNVFENDGFAGF